ncbi:unnamed protein product [Linum trigynum]
MTESHPPHPHMAVVCPFYCSRRRLNKLNFKIILFHRRPRITQKGLKDGLPRDIASAYAQISSLIHVASPPPPLLSTSNREKQLQRNPGRLMAVVRLKEGIDGI